MPSNMAKESAGGIVVRKDGKIALICQHSNSWSFPKGGVEEGETALEAAKREIEEETGIKDLEYKGELGSYERYSIAKDGVGETIEFGKRKRTFFLFTTNETDITSHDAEVTEGRFVTVDEAQKMLTHPKDREFLESVRGKIREVK